MNLFVGQLSYDAGEDELREAFEPFGEIVSVAVIRDRETGRHRGFGFVEFGSAEQGQAAINAMDGTSICGRRVVVNEARPRAERAPRPRR
ncbi:MAG: RNA recognition motif domain-containing protein [Vulcanimicrobiota bacterium]